MLPDGPTTSECKMTLPNVTNSRLTDPPSNLIADNGKFLTASSDMLHIDKILPGIYFSTTIDFWSQDRLRSHGFTHIIYIDRHIRRNSAPTIKDDSSIRTTPASVQSLSIINTSKQFLQGSTHKCLPASYNILDLNFGEESFLTTVLPNCYKAVKFIEKALQNGGTILIIDQFSDQKCLTVVVGYLMYKNNINFNDAFQRVKNVFKKAELQPFFISQLYEYEPILQVERAQLRGHSCSRELRSAQLKRKKHYDDSFYASNDLNFNNYQHVIVAANNSSVCNDSNGNGDVVME